MLKSKKKNHKITIVKEIKKDIKVKEIQSESELEKDIEESQVEHFGKFISSDAPRFSSTPTLSSNGLPEQITPERNRTLAPRTANSEEDNVKPYASGTDMDDSKRHSYNPSLGQDTSAMLPENRTMASSQNSSNPFSANSLDNEVQQKYAAKEFSPTPEKKPKRYSWEV